MHSDATTVGDYLSELDDGRRQAISAVRRVAEPPCSQLAWVSSGIADGATGSIPSSAHPSR